MKRLSRVRTILVLCASAGLLAACASDTEGPEPLEAGSRVPKVTLLDQNDEPHTIDESVAAIFFAREMEGGEVIRKLLDEEGPQFLQKHRALYVADISGMPTLIAKMIAIPKMRDERPYPTLLDHDGTATASYPSEEGRVTILLLDRLRVEKVEYRGSVAGLKDAVEKR